MGRRMISRFAYYLRLTIASALSLPICAVSNAAATKPTAVYPTGSFPLDVQNVQAAVSLGGVVLLKARNAAGQPMAFNFGPPDPVNGAGVDLTTDVSILGERTGPTKTTIDGGLFVFMGQTPVKSRIEGIDFEAPLGAAIILFASTGTDIIGNHINGVIGVPVVFGTDGDGIDLLGSDDPQSVITGRVRIANNLIENLGADFANGMQLDGVSAEVRISGNTVHFARSKGHVQTIGITAIRSHNRVSIVDNEVGMGPGNPNAAPVPIFVSGDHDARYFIAHNDVLSDHPNGDGIIVTGGDFSEPTQGAVVSENRVSINSSSNFLSGIDVYGAVNDSLLENNLVRGVSDSALDVGEGFDSTSTSDADRFRGNDISQHVSLTTDVYFGTNTSDMIFTGSCKSDIDLGVDNQIACDAPMRRSSNVAGGSIVRTHMQAVAKMNVRRALLDAVRLRMAR
jgi:hypothetical protein